MSFFSNVTFIQENIYEFMEALPLETLDQLYANPATCLAVFRSLPELAKLYVMRLLYVDSKKKPIPLVLIKYSWCLPTASKAHDLAIKKLLSLKICSVSDEDITVHSAFRKNLKNALTGGGPNNSFGVTSTKEDHKSLDIPLLDKYAKEHWESILHFIAGIESVTLPAGVKNLLVRSGLMQIDPTLGFAITKKGFQFLLQDVNSQIWAFLIQYVEMTEKELNMNMVDVVNFLFQLGSLTLGRSYSMDSLTETQQTLVDDLKDFGAIYQRKEGSSRFYPTRLATSLTSGHAAASASESEGFIIVETNFKVYAYTDSPLQIAILNFFVNLLYRFPNMVVGVIRRESIVRALSRGISAQQIIGYLHTNAHPQMKVNPPLVPPTVADQIRLWQMERDRLQRAFGFLYDEFASLSEFQVVKKHAEDIGILLYANPTVGTGLLVVSPEGHDKLKEYIASRRQ